MGILLSFLPFIAFALLSNVLPVAQAVFAGAVVAIVLLVRDRLVRRRSVKILEAGTVVLFAGLGLLLLAVGGNWSVLQVRLAVDIGLLVIVLLSMLLRQPFTLQYAREQVSPEVAAMPQFLSTNYVITGAWALAFAAMVVADLIMVFRPDLPLSIGVRVTIIALVGAIWFTKWYPSRVRRGADGRGAGG